MEIGVPFRLFQSTLPVGGATGLCFVVRPLLSYFNPRSPWGERLDFYNPVFANLGISIHAPRGGSDITAEIFRVLKTNFNPRSPWGERPVFSRGCDQSIVISIHAPRGGSDYITFIKSWQTRNFNPRSPWGERLNCTGIHIQTRAFQSTLPVGGATPEEIGP